MTKIDRDVRLAQHEFAYETMSEEQLLAWREATNRAADYCHAFVWTTQPFLFVAGDCL